MAKIDTLARSSLADFAEKRLAEWRATASYVLRQRDSSASAVNLCETDFSPVETYMGVPLQRETLPAQRFLVEPPGELADETMHKRSQHIKAILRLAMLTGSQMQLEPSLSLLCDLAADIVPYSAACVYFWNEAEETMELRVSRGNLRRTTAGNGRGSTLNFWAGQFAKPLLVTAGSDLAADAELATVNALTAVVVPLFVRGRVLGSLQLFGSKADCFTAEDAHLLWIMALVADNLLTREQTNESLLRFAFTDYLTGLRTRGYFEQQLELEFKRSERHNQGFALLMVDIDFFKSLNDRYGHHVGDRVLREVTSLLVTDMREVDTVARYGGEEFVIILPETTEAEAEFVAQRLRKTIQDARFQTGVSETGEKLTISIGISMYPTDSQSSRGLIEAADAALYGAKKHGRNEVMKYSHLMQRERKEVS
jgi:diguanylate cyclase (GGDEF)-like protein